MKLGFLLLSVLGQYACLSANAQIEVISDTIRKKQILPTLTIDRPDQTDSPYIIPVGFFQIETGIQHVWDYYKADDINYSYRSLIYPNLLLRYAILKNVEMRLEGNYSVDNTVNEKVRNGMNQTKGWHPVLLATKVKLYDQKGWRPSLALLVKLFTPFHSRKDLDLKHKYTPGLVGAFSHSIADRFVLDGSVGGAIDQLSGKVNVNYSLSQAIGFTEKLAMFGEIFAVKPAGQKEQFGTDTGLLYMILPHLQLDIYASKSLSYEADDVFVGVGMGIRLPR